MKRVAEFILPNTVMLFIILVVTMPRVCASDPAKGRTHYERQCANCHGRDGAGMAPDMPNFRKGDGLWSSDSQLVRRIEKGKNGCPPFLGMLDQQSIFDLISYLRTFR